MQFGHRKWTSYLCQKYLGSYRFPAHYENKQYFMYPTSLTNAYFFKNFLSFEHNKMLSTNTMTVLAQKPVFFHSKIDDGCSNIYFSFRFALPENLTTLPPMMITFLQGAFTIYVNRIFHIFDHLPTPSLQSFTFG